MKISNLKFISVFWLALMAQISLAENDQIQGNSVVVTDVSRYEAPHYAWPTFTRRGNRMLKVNCAFVTHYLFDSNLQAFYLNGKQLNEKEFCARNR